MRVIRYGSGWDIALDMVFTDQVTAGTIAARLLPAIHALVREAVDASMRERNAANDVTKEIFSQQIPLENLGRAPVSDTNGTNEPWSGPHIPFQPWRTSYQVRTGQSRLATVSTVFAKIARRHRHPRTAEDMVLFALEPCIDDVKLEQAFLAAEDPGGTVGGGCHAHHSLHRR